MSTPDSTRPLPPAPRSEGPAPVRLPDPADAAADAGWDVELAPSGDGRAGPPPAEARFREALGPRPAPADPAPTDEAAPELPLPPSPPAPELAAPEPTAAPDADADVWIARGDGAAASPAPGADAGAPQADDTDGAPRVLLAEADPTSARVLQHRLGRDGFAVSLADDAASALAALAEGGLDLLIVDAALPGGAFDVLRRMRNGHGDADLPAIVLAWPGNDLAAVRAFGVGSDDVVTRPFSLTEVSARARYQVRRSQDDRLADRIASRVEERLLTRLEAHLADHIADRLADRVEGRLLGRLESHLADRLTDRITDRLSDRLATDRAQDPGDDALADRIEATLAARIEADLADRIADRLADPDR